MSQSGRRFLVVVRAGESSLHRGWLHGPDRNWDFFVSWYGRGAYQPAADEKFAAIPGGKWDGLFKTFAAFPDLTDYAHVWLPDDDIATDCANISRMFELAERHELDVCQPGLTADSYFTYPHTLASRSFMLRYSALVEIMVPCLSRRTLLRTIPLMQDTMSGFGLDFIWSRFEKDNFKTAAILDAVTVRHTRPVGAFLAGRANKAGHNSMAALRDLVRRFGIVRPHRCFWPYAGISKEGERPMGRLQTALYMAIDCLKERASWRQPRAGRKYLSLFTRLTRKPALSQLIMIEEPSSSPGVVKRGSV